jgi:predicted Rossmann fold flavoprotein
VFECTHATQAQWLSSIFPFREEEAIQDLERLRAVGGDAGPYAVVVIGAGAAGFMAALFAARARDSAGGRQGPRGRGVLLLERPAEGGKKILMSGGGRCNVLPSVLHPSRYVTGSSPNTMRNILLSWPLAEQRRFFEEELGLALALEEETGKLFPVSNTARDVRDGLRATAERAGAVIRGGAVVVGIDSVGESDAIGARRWRVRLADGGGFDAARVIIATGGLSVPATGSDGTGIDIVRRLGHTIHETYPALTPLTCSPPRYGALSGVSLRVRLSAPGPKRALVSEGGFLFTHKGYSGPSVLDLSHLAVQSRRAGGGPQPFFVRWTERDAASWDRLLRPGEGSVGGSLRRHLPSRLVEALLSDAGVPAAASLSHLDRDARARVVAALTRHPLPWTGDEGYVKAEVTGGGVALDEIDPRTLESRLHPGLYLCGEILDALGPIGGYNFAWAWATGRAAGLAAGGESTAGGRTPEST